MSPRSSSRSVDAPEEDSGGGRRSRRAASRLLAPGETVVLIARPSRFGTLPRYLFTLGMYGIWRKRDVSVVTDRRILRGRGVFNRYERSIPMSTIDGAAFSRRGLVSYSELTIDEHGNRRLMLIGPLSSRLARRFTAEVQRRI